MTLLCLELTLNIMLKRMCAVDIDRELGVAFEKHNLIELMPFESIK
jgi:hypothetical protein